MAHRTEITLKKMLFQAVYPAVILLRTENIRFLQARSASLFSAALIYRGRQTGADGSIYEIQLFIASADRQAVFIIIAQITHMELAEGKEIKRMILTLQQIESKLAVCIKHIAQDRKIRRNVAQDPLDQADENDILIYSVIVLVADGHKLPRLKPSVFNVLPLLAVDG